MSQRLGDKSEMPDVPKSDFVDALTEIWFQINFAAYHMATCGCMASEASPDQNACAARARTGRAGSRTIDIVVSRSHLAAFFWHLEHVFEALRTAITRGQKEHPEAKYFWAYEKELDELEQLTIVKRSKTIAIWGTKTRRLLAVSGQ